MNEMTVNRLMAYRKGMAEVVKAQSQEAAFEDKVLEQAEDALDNFQGMGSFGSLSPFLFWSADSGKGNNLWLRKHSMTV